jgi:hypothetical protein
MKENMKTCDLCLENKDLSLFYNSKYTVDKYTHRCKVCMDNTYPSFAKNKEMHEVWRDAANRILSKMKDRSQKKGYDWDDSWWTSDRIIERIAGKQCEVTSIPFSLEKPKKKNARRPFVPSPDRKDNALGYVPNNVQFVVWIYNLMKNSFDKDELELFIQALKKTK